MIDEYDPNTFSLAKASENQMIAERNHLVGSSQRKRMCLIQTHLQHFLQMLYDIGNNDGCIDSPGGVVSNNFVRWLDETDGF